MPSMQDKLRDKFSGVLPSDAQRMLLVELSRVQPNPDQPRKTFNEESLLELADSIKQYGQLMPIVLKHGNEPDTYILAAGERRYRAHQLLGKTHIYAVLTEGGIDEVSLIENIQREDLHPLELAESLSRLMDKHAWNQEQLGRAIGKNRRTINETLRLNELPEEIKQEYRTSSSDVSKSLLIQIVRLNGPEEQLALWQQARDGGVTVREARSQRKGVSTAHPSSPAKMLLASGKTFARRMQNVVDSELTDDDRYQLVELRKEINNLIDDLVRQ